LIGSSLIINQTDSDTKLNTIIPDTVKFGILIIGDEILSGRRKDKHLEQSIKILSKQDFQLSWARIVGDDINFLAQQLREIHQLQHPCFSFGGIGATVDDRTRQAVAMALGRKMVRHPDAVKEIEAQFGEQAYPNRILMADLPAAAEIIPNPYNRVPGFSVEHFHCLPGFPEMAWPMMEWVLDNKYQHLPRNHVTLRSFILHDAQESDLVDLLEQFQNRFPRIKISSLPRLVNNNRRWVELGIQGIETDVEAAEESIGRSLREHGFIPRKPE